MDIDKIEDLLRELDTRYSNMARLLQKLETSDTEEFHLLEGRLEKAENELRDISARLHDLERK